MAPAVKSLLWVDDEAELLESHGIFLREKGYEVQVLTVVTRILEGPRIRQQAVARRFVERFRAIELERDRGLDWRGWIERYSEQMRWDVDLAAANEMGLYDSLRGLYPDMHREIAAFMTTAYPSWLKNLDGDRPLDANLRDVPADPRLRRGVVGRGAEVLHLDDVRQRQG